MSSLRRLESGDEAALESFLRARPDTTMFLRSNLHQAGIVYTGEPYTATYVAAFELDEVVAVAAHSWGGKLLVEAPSELEAVACAAVRASSRPVEGIIGCSEQVRAARAALGLEATKTMMDSSEDLLALDLDSLAVPPELGSAGTSCRAPHPDELGLLSEWRVAYSIEALGMSDSAQLRRQSREEMELYQRGERHWVLDEGGEAVSYSAFNAQLPDCVQIGGVYTPPELRSRRRARSVVAGSLLLARDAGVKRSVLFTARDNHSAQRAYRALGYECVGDYAILLFAEPQTGF
jgi:hypothetical protein